MNEKTTEQPPAAVPLDPLVGRFFVNTGDGIEFVDSRSEAIRRCDEAIAEYRLDATSDGEWCDDIEAVCWGVVMGRAEADHSQDCDDPEINYCDYGLADLPSVDSR